MKRNSYIKYYQIFCSALVIIFLGCKADINSEKAVTESTLETIIQTVIPDTLEAEGFPISSKMLSSADQTISIQNEFWVKGFWFNNKNKAERLYVSPVTDYYKYKQILFYPKRIPEPLLKQFDAFHKSARITTQEETLALINEVPKELNSLGNEFFQSTHGFSLDDSVAKIIQFYPVEGDIIKRNQFTVVTYKFVGAEFASFKKPAPKWVVDNYGQTIFYFFENDLLIAMYIENYIP